MRVRPFVPALATITLAFTAAAQGNPTLTGLVEFTGANGFEPEAPLVFDATGNLYGTTDNGGSDNLGTVFELSGASYTTATTIFSFNDSSGGHPQSGLLVDGAGNLYGTTSNTVFELSGANHQTLTTLFTFSGSTKAFVVAGPIADSAGNLYGTTETGGDDDGGTVFELSGSSHQTLTTLLSFNGSDGAGPVAPLYMDSAGNLYGTTSGGGTYGPGGTVFELSGPNHQTLTTLVNFTGANGRNPEGGLIADSAGNLYGTTVEGGTNYDGTVFELSGSSHQIFTTLVNFNTTNGDSPYDSLIIDAAGNLFGTTDGGGGGAGSIFELSGSNHQTLTTLASFDETSAGDDPQAALVADDQGNLLGTTPLGGTNNNGGAVFELTDSGFVVPEPTSLSLLAAGGLFCIRRRAKRSR